MPAERRALWSWAFWLWLGWMLTWWGPAALHGGFLLAYLFLLLAIFVIWLDEKVVR